MDYSFDDIEISVIIHALELLLDELTAAVKNPILSKEEKNNVHLNIDFVKCAKSKLSSRLSDFTLNEMKVMVYCQI